MSELVSQKKLDAHLLRMDDVLTEYFKGKTPQEIAKTTELSVVTVNNILKEWRGLAQNNEAMKRRATEAVRNVDSHYNKLIKEAYRLMEDAESAGSLPQRAVALKMVVDIEKTRIDLLQKAGVLEDSDMSKHVVEMERKQEILTNILKEVVGPCPRCRPKVQQALAQITNEIVVMNVDE
jgi:hypothetical protein